MGYLFRQVINNSWKLYAKYADDSLSIFRDIDNTTEYFAMRLWKVVNFIYWLFEEIPTWELTN